MPRLELEKPTLKDIIESTYFRARVGEIRSRTFEDLETYGSYQRVREYGFTVEASREGIFISDVVRGRTRSITPHAIFNSGEGVILVDVHSHKILGGHYAL
ncbi:MAG TPA: hypothetical protein VJG90_02390, partial [Candidatus Nanoarchaeia archaeon]|nr:hypothetical protein [Candidatus Nanoarchaeia archaeon]